jgi:thiamine-phosphate pyrophosphorylase
MGARQHAWPRLWLMTDERLGDRLWSAIDRLPKQDSGIVFRHYSLADEAREALAQRVATIAAERGLTLAVAGDPNLAVRLGASLVHNPPRLPCPLPFSRSAHSLVEAESARADGAALVFVSPVHETSTHPGRPALGASLASEIAEVAGVPALALGGMNARNFADLPPGRFYGWAGIDAWI